MWKRRLRDTEVLRGAVTATDRRHATAEVQLRLEETDGAEPFSIEEEVLQLRFRSGSSGGETEVLVNIGKKDWSRLAQGMLRHDQDKGLEALAAALIRHLRTRTP